MSIVSFLFYAKQHCLFFYFLIYFIDIIDFKYYKGVINELCKEASPQGKIVSFFILLKPRSPTVLTFKR